MARQENSSSTQNPLHANDRVRINIAKYQATGYAGGNLHHLVLLLLSRSP